MGFGVPTPIFLSDVTFIVYLIIDEAPHYTIITQFLRPCSTGLIQDATIHLVFLN